MNRLILLCVVGLTACQLAYTGGAKAVRRDSVPEGWLRAAPTPVIVQAQRRDCGLAALAMVAGAWGRTWSLDELTQQVPPGDQGVTLGRLRDFARAHGLDAYAVTGTFADLAHELENGHPVLLGLLLPFDHQNNLRHYEVAVAMNPADQTVVTRDPATGALMQRTKKILDLEWGRAGYATMVVIGERGTSGADLVRKENLP